MLASEPPQADGASGSQAARQAQPVELSREVGLEDLEPADPDATGDEQAMEGERADDVACEIEGQSHEQPCRLGIRECAQQLRR